MTHASSGARKLRGEEVAQLHAPEESAPPRTDAMAEWRRTLRGAYLEATVLGAPDDPPIDGVLSIDQALDYLR